VPHTCRSVQSRRDLLVSAIEPSGVVLLHHPCRDVPKRKATSTGFAPASGLRVARRRFANRNPPGPPRARPGASPDDRMRVDGAFRLAAREEEPPPPK
jgi:hypothetical protein